jgi:hypothetical protein
MTGHPKAWRGSITGKSVSSFFKSSRHLDIHSPTELLGFLSRYLHSPLRRTVIVSLWISAYYCVNDWQWKKFQVLTAEIMKFRVFWDVTPCSLFGVDLCFRGAYYLHHQGNRPTPRLRCATSQKILKFERPVVFSVHQHFILDVNTSTCSSFSLITTMKPLWIHVHQLTMVPN